MRLIDADVLKQHIDKLPALPDGNFAGNHSALKALINMQPTIEQSTNCSEFPNNSDTINRRDAIEALDCINGVEEVLRSLPSAQPERKEGHWIEGGIYRDVIECYCSECGQLMTTAATVRMNYCPRCGAYMRGGQHG